MPRGWIYALTLLVAVTPALLPTSAAARRTLDLQGPGDPNRTACDIVVKRPGGNPTQDMTGSIGHAKSHQSGGGRANPLICYLPGTR
ncbi:hypothetical protein [Methylorubrum aminovorans]|uniref:Uncharacterized protein n=1 Tax=Methylorubrum aminovorans TaxID=269069 RepID=A0ABQ4UDJ3_9HYPH|nr:MULTISPECIES: hypothetical protein [Methylobacteriaceae]AWI91203.1 hypothetical protein C0214_25190 [Methylobacterium sp. DM1]QIJ77195.1 hypothetical protein CLZ_23060 [Methylobacterium sp. CLZ]QIJ82099.1 hypothetical protein GU700_23055 [Methylobacterium sp. NI91]GJE64568.1 hypothetical protein LNAOJCKE_1774 [Methylorubrum aminovorans]GMA75972.1 hypothetical protein GCM10025880_23890 [Methylorubrum aminovorans]